MTSFLARPRPLAVLLVAGALALGGCGSDDDPVTTTGASGTTSTSATAGTTSTGATPSADGTTTAGTSTGTTGGTTDGGSGGATDGGSGGATAGGTSGAADTGDEATYVRTLEGVCQKVARASQTFVGEVTKIEGSAAARNGSIQAFKEPMTRFFDTIGRYYAELTKAEPPAKWARYQASLRSDAEGVARYLDEATQLLEEARTNADLAKLQQLMARTNFNTGDAPRDLAAKTPTCNPRSAAGAGG